ncbi:hypothetical protein NPIL_79191 [Nephila pilipes]|uniref:HTH CENPB-type domain-containing protein n=1 Tax=Nephila pilipes TaxID=299642 RepID=A0A8X6JGG3_NEPPI|nr:hypothetical protein NPIL_79191 [Nephila pilipes]
MISEANITHSGSNLGKEMAKVPYIWLGHEAKRNMRLSEAIKMENTKTIFSNIQNVLDDTSENSINNRGWFHRFKNRYNIHNIQITEKYQTEIQKSCLFPTVRTNIERRNYHFGLVFNVDETGLF